MAIPSLGYLLNQNQNHDCEVSNVPEGIADVELGLTRTASTTSKGGGNGAYLTWEDLGVRVTISGTGETTDGSPLSSSFKSILQGVSGYALPGEVVAIMGPSGSGKSTLLDALAGRLASNARQTGEVLINGRKQKLTYGTSAYLSQEDILTWTLTVKEVVNYSAELQLPKSMTRAEKMERAERSIREMGLQDAMNTRIGGWGSKGISGSQKRRVSICVEILTHPKILFLDEPTSGLDSADSFYVMSQIAKLARRHEMTIIASIHQPSREVFGLFKTLSLLSLGRTIYFGPSRAANEFFAVNGFPCPPLQNPADHYLRIINTDFDEDIDQGIGREIPTEQLIEMLVESYKSSETFKNTRSEIGRIRTQGGGVIEKNGSQSSVVPQCLVLTKRSFLNMYWDFGYYWLRLGMYIVLAFGLGTVFYDLGGDHASISARGSMLMFVASFLTILAIGGFPSFVEDMKVFEQERLNGHYAVGAFVVGNTLSSIPYLLVISLVPAAITYYLVGLQRHYEQFLYFTLVLFTCMLLVEGLMMIVASMVPNFLMGLITSAGVQGLMILSGGFFRLPNDLPIIFWRHPMYDIAFHKYAFQGLNKSEFDGLTFPTSPQRGSPTIDGQTILKEVWQIEMSYSKWVDLAILLGMAFLYRLLFFCTIKTFEKVKPFLFASNRRHKGFCLFFFFFFFKRIYVCFNIPL